jgi:hypothetical protein
MHIHSIKRLCNTYYVFDLNVGTILNACSLNHRTKLWFDPQVVTKILGNFFQKLGGPQPQEQL